LLIVRRAASPLLRLRHCGGSLWRVPLRCVAALTTLCEVASVVGLVDFVGVNSFINL